MFVQIPGETAVRVLFYSMDGFIKKKSPKLRKYDVEQLMVKNIILRSLKKAT